jgi:hypothetical protein
MTQRFWADEFRKEFGGQIRQMLAGMIEIDNLDGTGKMQVG